MVAEDDEGNGATTYDRLIALLDRQGAQYRLIDHAPEGRTEIVSAMRGHSPASAAKCMVIMAKLGRKQTKYVLAVVTGDARIDLGALKEMTGATYVAFATPSIAEELAGSAVGTVLPFAFDERLELIVDPGLLALPEIFFNAARLDRSIGLKTADYVRIARPIAKRIVAP